MRKARGDSIIIGLSCSMLSLKLNARHRFKFELGWLLRDGFDDMVKRVWSAPVSGNSPVRRWNAKIRNLRKYLRGWARHTTGILKKEKERLCTIIDELDRAAEIRVLTQQEIELKANPMQRWHECCGRKSSDGTKDQNLTSF